MTDRVTNVTRFFVVSKARCIARQMHSATLVTTPPTQQKKESAMQHVPQTKPRIGLFAIGLEAYWGQFPGLREELLSYYDVIAQQLSDRGAEVIGAGMVDTAQAATAAGQFFAKSQVDLLLANGALAVGVGTPFALSEESCIPTHTKRQMIQNNNLKNMQGVVNQNAIIFEKIDQPDDYNNTRSLKIGIATGQRGHVFSGAAIKSITTIESVQKIMMRLTHD
jgi:hypothetical protein